MRLLMILLAGAIVLAGSTVNAPAAAANALARFLEKVQPVELMPGAESFGEIAGDPAAAPILKDGTLAGYAFLNSDLVNAVGYSGKPIHILLGMNTDGVITGIRLVDHHEPIVLIGIPEQRIESFIQSYVGRNIVAEATTTEASVAELDIISGATVTVMVIDDSIRRAALKLARTRGLGGLATPQRTGPEYVLADQGAEIRDWTALTGDGSVRRMTLSVGDVNQAFDDAGNTAAADRSESESPEDVFIDLHAALVSIPTIGMSLLGDREYAVLEKRLDRGKSEHAILVMGNGLYSFKGSGYVRGGIFDRIQLIQGDTAIRFRDRHHRRIADIAADGAPRFDEIALFRVPEAANFDPAAPWRVELLVQRAIGARDKAFITFDLAYRPPERYLTEVTPPAAAEPAAETPDLAAPGEASLSEQGARDKLWQRIWRDRVVDIAILAVALGVLTLIFFFQDWLVRRPMLTAVVRYGFLIFVLGWLGFYANAQLSVVNVLTFTNSLITDFNWAYFLMDPLVFILWVAVAAGLLFWGRGAFCGWLCPFGALQELTNHLGRRLGIKQIALPWGLNERLWPVKYIIFLVLFAASLYSLSLAERLSEVEPFKTAIILNFVRAWPFVAFAVALIVVNLFIERFFCRYMCPLGAALAIPARIRMFDWLKRHRECGNPCHRCANECPVAAIHPDGHINVNECIYCLDCQKLYYDDQRCPHMIQRRLKRERRLVRQSDSTLTESERAEKQRLMKSPEKKAEESAVSADV